MTDRRGPLAGIRVLDVATLVAAPLAATVLGEFGADVIKVEQPGSGDSLRPWGDQKDGVGLAWKSVGRNKRSVTLDLRQSRGRDLLRRLIETSDVLVLNTRPSTLRRWNLAWEDVRAINSSIVMLHVTGFGAGGPDHDRPGFGTLAEAMSGFAQLVGPADGPPSLPPFMLADGVASQTAAFAVMVALYERDVNGGAGQLIDMNLIEPLARLAEIATLAYDQLGTIQVRDGNRWATGAPRNTYLTRDGRWLAMSSAAPSIAQRVYRAIGRPDLADDPDYVDPRRRVDHATEIDELVASWVGERSLDEAMSALLAEGAAAAPVYDASQLLSDPHLAARGTFVPVADDELGSVRVQAPVPRLSETPAAVRHLGPKLGAHNDEVFGSLLGLSSDVLSDLRADGVI